MVCGSIVTAVYGAGGRMSVTWVHEARLNRGNIYMAVIFVFNLLISNFLFIAHKQRRQRWMFTALAFILFY
jgi:hypothetical protein